MPIRTCVACRGRFEKAELLRWIVDAGGAAVLDRGARLPGRGAYVCRRRECFEILRRRRKSPVDFEANEPAFRLAIEGGVVQNVSDEE